MHVLFCHDKFYIKGRDENVYSYGAFPYSLWESRFLPHFSSLCVLGIKRKRSDEENGILDLSSGKGVEHVLLPSLSSPAKRLFQSLRVYRKIKEQVKKADAVIIRGSHEYALLAAYAARCLKKPYAVEMTSCAYDVHYYNGSTFGRIYAALAYRITRYMVHHADAVMYVTESFLQSRYPTNGAMSYAPNVEIAASPEYVLDARLKRAAAVTGEGGMPVVIGMIGNFMGGFRGLDVALEALGIVRQMAQEEGAEVPPFIFRILGHGNACQWQEQIAAYGLDGMVEFCGAVPRGAAVLEWLDGVDLYLQTGFHQGLPRTMIEAMSRGCAVLASDAGGTTELIENHFIHPRGDVHVLAAHIISMLQGAHYAQQAKRNFRKAKEYSREFLAPKRHQFWADFALMAKKPVETEVGAS